jgi:hypothetical protein
VQDQSAQQMQGLEGRMADMQAQMLAAQQVDDKADAQVKQLLQEKEQTVSSTEQREQDSAGPVSPGNQTVMI